MWDLSAIRRQFPALARTEAGLPIAYFDGPAGSQVPQSVIDAVGEYLGAHNANRGACFGSSRETDSLIAAAHQAVADFVGATDPGEISFGANMTTITLGLSRALGRTWQAGDELIVSRLDHDANVTPWVLAARDSGATVHYIDLQESDHTLDLDSYKRCLSNRTKLVAVGMASNATGTVNPVKEIVALAKNVGALTFLDAVHFAPHRLIDVAELGCDFLACSAYKFFGPHVGVLWGRRELLETLQPYKLRPAPEALPCRWMTGTQSHEGIHGTRAAVDYLASLGHDPQQPNSSRRQRLQLAFERIEAYEQRLAAEFLEQMQSLRQFRIWGITDPRRIDERVPTFSLTHPAYTPAEMSRRLAELGLWTWAGNHYALPFTETVGLEPDGTLRAGLLHYNSLEEVRRLVAGFASL